MKLQSILVIFIVRLLLCGGEFTRVLVKFGLETHMVEGGFTKMGFYLFWWVQTFELHFLDSDLFFGPSCSHCLCYLN